MDAPGGLCAAGCGQETPVPTPPAQENTEPGMTGVANPVTESTQQEILDTLGFSMPAPEGAQNARWSKINAGDGAQVGQLCFLLGEQDVTFRMAAADVSADVLGVENATVFSGMHYDWTATDVTTVAGLDAMAYWNEGAEGVLLWYDTAPGLLYCVSVSGDASVDGLTTLAEMLYVPTQGEV